MAISGMSPARGDGKMEAPAAEGRASITPRVAYVSEIPYHWQAENGNQLEWWAKELSMAWAAGAEAGGKPGNLLPQLSWERLAMTSRKGSVEAMVVHGYEFFEQRQTAGMDMLLVPAKAGVPAMAEFVVLRRKPSVPQRLPFSMQDFAESKSVYVDRGGCGELVYRWLDLHILRDTGTERRKNLMQFHSAASATEAVLAVYFDDAYACVVSRDALNEVMCHNPEGLGKELEEVRCSPPLLSHVIACPARKAGEKAATAASRIQLISAVTGAGRFFTQEGTRWSLMAPKPEHLASLEALVVEWKTKFAPDSPGAPEKTPAVTGNPPPHSRAVAERRHE